MKIKLTLIVLSLALITQAMSMQKRSVEGMRPGLECKTKDLVKKNPVEAPCPAEITLDTLEKNNQIVKVPGGKNLKIEDSVYINVKYWLSASTGNKSEKAIMNKSPTKFTFVRKKGNQCRYRISKSHFSRQRACVSFDIVDSPATN